jgi:hypothetical protein
MSNNWAVIAGSTPGGGVGGSAPTAPGNGSFLVSAAFINPVSLQCALTVYVTPGTGTYIGNHFYVDVGDASGTPAAVVGTTPIGTAPVGSVFSPIDLGKETYNAAAQPITLSFQAPSAINPNVSTPCRLYGPSFSAAVDNPLVPVGTTGASPNIAFSLVPLAQGQLVSGSEVTAPGGPMTIPPYGVTDDSTGKLMTAYTITLTPVPPVQGWVFQLVLVWGTNDPTLAASQSVVAGPFSGAKPGPIYGSPDKIATPHTFALPTPTTIQPATVYLQAGLIDANGVYHWNAINPGITASAPIWVGTSNGRTIDGTAVTQYSIAVDSFAASVKGVAIFTANPALPSATYPAGAFAFNITTPAFLRVNTAGTAWQPAVTSGDTDSSIVSTTYLVANYVTAATIAAAYASFTYLSANYTTTTSLVATYASLSYLTSNYTTTTNLTATYATLTYLNSNFATIATLNALTITANQITGGTCTATVSFTSPQISGGSILMTSGTKTMNIDTTNWFKVTDTTSPQYAQISPGTFTASLTSGASSIVISPSSIAINGPSSQTLTISASSGISIGTAGAGIWLILNPAAGTGAGGAMPTTALGFLKVTTPFGSGRIPIV